MKLMNALVVHCRLGEWATQTSLATHVLFPSESTPPASPSATSASTPEYFRTLARSGGRALIHVWYRPDSYDTWLPAADFASPEPEPPAKVGAWEVGTKWLRDGVRYNELMNEEDYEREEQDEATDAPEPAAVAADTKPRKRVLPEEATDEAEAGASGGAGETKRIKLHVAARPVGAVPVDVSGASGPPATGKKYEVDPIPGGAIGNISGMDDAAGPSRLQGEAPSVRVAGDGDVSMADGEAKANGGANKDEEADEEEDAAPDQAALEEQRQRAEETARKYLAEQTQEVIIPSYSTWFDMGSINAIEKRSLPEFFNNRNRSKTPAIYKDYRDFMINTYRLNPSEYLTVTACRRNLAGDVCAIMRVHAFLEQWGLINYQVSISE